MRPLSMIKIAMFVILVPGAALGDTELDVERIIEDVLKKKDENGEDKAQYMYMLGNICYNQEKYLEALKWYTEAAAKGHTDAQFALGSMYFNGMGIQKDYSEALKWYTEAAAKGHTDAQFVLGSMYMLGNLYSNQKDYSEALKWYTEAAAKGHTIKKGRKLIISVAREGNAIAQYLFGQLMDIEKRYEEAYYWLTLARKQEKDLERAGLLSDSLSTRLDELEDLIGHKKPSENPCCSRYLNRRTHRAIFRFRQNLNRKARMMSTPSRQYATDVTGAMASDRTVAPASTCSRTVRVGHRGIDARSSTAFCIQDRCPWALLPSCFGPWKTV